MRGILPVFVLFVATNFATAEERWDRFRGPSGTGVATSAKLPATWSESSNVRWKTEIPGRGWSSPVIWDEQVWLTTATEDGTRMFAICVDRATGTITHNKLVFENVEPRFCHPTNSYASPTPTVEEGRVYVHFGSYGTACLDTETAEIIWQRRDFVSDDFRGPGSSPIVDGDLLFVNFDGVDFQFVVALDKHSGETVWNVTRDIDYGTDNGDNKKAYGTPGMIEVGGRRQLVSPAAVETITYDPQTGRELWRVKHGGMNAAAPPILYDGLVFIAAGSGDESLIAVRPEGTGDLTESGIAWRSGQTIPKRSAPIVIDGLVFLVADNGVASCRDAKTGEIYWQTRLPGDYWASPVLADGKFFLFNKEGDMPVLAASKTMKKLAVNRLDDGCNATPAIADDALFIRTVTHLYRIEDLDSSAASQ